MKISALSIQMDGALIFCLAAAVEWTQHGKLPRRQSISTGYCFSWLPGGDEQELPLYI